MHVNIDINIGSRNSSKMIEEHSRNISSIQSTIEVGPSQFSHVEA